MALNTDVLSPLDETLTYDPQAQAVWKKCASVVMSLASIQAQLESLSNGLFQSIASNEGNTRLSPAAKAEDDAQFRNVYLTAVENLRRDAETARQNILSITTPLINPSGYVSGGVLGDSSATLVRIERTRDAWARIQWQLDAVETGQRLTRALRLAAEAAVSDDEFAMSALRQNLRAYLAAKVNLHYAPEDLASQLNSAMAPAATPAMRAAMLIEGDLAMGWPQVQFLLQQALNVGKASRTAMMTVSGLPGWPRQPTVTIGS